MSNIYAETPVSFVAGLRFATAVEKSHNYYYTLEVRV